MNTREQKKARASDAHPAALNIGYLIPSVGISGGINIILEHANRLADLGINIHIYTCSEETDIPWCTFNYINIKSIKKLNHILELSLISFDIFIITGWQTFYEALSIHVRSRRFFYFVQSIESKFYHSDTPEHDLSAFTYRIPLSYLTEAKWIARALKDYGHDATYAPNWVNKSIFYKDKPLIAKGRMMRVLIEGPASIPFKGLDMAFLAIKDLPGIETWCVSSSGKLKKWQEAHYFFEAQSLESMRRIYSSCDVLIKMSEVEGVFGPPLEMMACGGTAVVAKVTGSDEYIRHMKNGIEVPSKDWAAAREAIVMLRDNPDTLKKLQLGGEDTVSSYDWEKTITIISKLFSNISFSGPPESLWEIVDREHLRYETRVALRLYAKTFGLDPHVDFLSAERSYATARKAHQTTVGHAIKVEGWAQSPGVGSARSIRVTIGNERWATKKFARSARRDVDQAKGFENSAPGFAVVVGPIQKSQNRDVKVGVEAQFTADWHELAAPKSERVDALGYVEHIQLTTLVKVEIPDTVLAHREGFVLCLVTRKYLPEIILMNEFGFRSIRTSCFGENAFGSIYEIDDLAILESGVKNKHLVIGIPHSHTDVDIMFRRGYRV